MLVASGPYNQPIPFVTLQEIRLNTNTDGALVVTLGISNETATPTGAVILGNYVMVSAQKSEIVNLSRNIPRLIEAIKRDAEGRTELHLVESDFAPKINTSNIGEASQQVYNYVHEVTKVVKRADDLYALVVSYTNFQDQYTIGNIITDKLLSKKKVPTQANLYTLNETVSGYGTQGSIWPGAGHIHDKKIMAGASHTEFEHPFITAQPALNVKSKDMRVIQLAQSLRFDERPKSSGSPRSYFSPITLSRSSRGSLTGLFSFDHLRFAVENTRFGRLVKNDSTLISAARLKDIVIYQKILKVDTAGNELTPGRSSHGAISEQKMSTQVASLGSGLKITSASNNDTILNISFEDLDTEDLVGNFVEYSVEVLMDDNTGDALQSIVEKLSAELPRYEGPEAPPYKNIIDLYLAAVQAVFGPTTFRTLTANMWQKSLIALTAPTGLHAAEDQGVVLETIQEFTSKLNRAISTTQKNTSGTPNYHSKISAARYGGGARATHVFLNKYPIKNSAGYGLDYLEAHLIKSKNILPALSYESMNSRAKKELEKYSINNPTANSINTVGYLSPEVARLGAKLKPVPTDTLQNSNDNFVSILRSTKELNLVVSPEPEKDMATDKQETLALAGVSIRANEVSLRKQVFDTSIVKPTLPDSKSYLSINSGFTTVTTPEETALSGSPESIAKSKKLIERPTTAPVVTELIDKTITEYQTITKLANTGNIQGSIALAKAQQDNTLIEESDAMTNLLNFGSLVQVQYLAAYDRRQGVKKQNWKILTEKVVRNASTANRTLICRLVAMSNTLDAPTVVQLGALSSLFTLGPGFVSLTFPTFEALFDRILGSLIDDANISLKDIDSVDTLYANNMPLSSKVTVTMDPNQDSDSSQRPGRRRPRPTGGVRY